MRRAVVLLAIACAACTAAPPDRAPHEGARARSIAALHEHKCGSCHEPPAPKSRSRTQIESALSRHKSRLHLTSDEWGAMVEYLGAADGSTAKQRD